MSRIDKSSLTWLIIKRFAEKRITELSNQLLIGNDSSEFHDLSTTWKNRGHIKAMNDLLKLADQDQQEI